MVALGRRARRFPAFAGGACLLAGLLPALAVAEPAADEASPIFRTDRVAVIDLTLSEASAETLEEEPSEYVPGGFSLAYADGPDEVGAPVATLPEVGIRLKGGLFGSFRPLSGKAGFKLKFNEYVKQRFLGLKKLTLNNMVQDPSMLHEGLAYDVFRAVDVAAPRTGYAYVRLNGENVGLYANVETFDDVGLERWFGAFDDPQHLYEGEYATDVAPGSAPLFSVDEGDEADLSDLEALIAAVAADDVPFSTRIAGRANLEQMTRMWAVEKYVGHWDGYSGAGPSLFPTNELPNNYYLYADVAGEFQMLPWGTDQTWGRRISFDGEAGILFDECLADQDCRLLFREALVEVGQAVEPLALSAVAAQRAALLEPWQAIVPSREEAGAVEIEEEVEGTRHFIVDRPGELAEWLAANPTPSSPPGDSDADDPGGDLAPAAIGKRASLRLGRIAVAGSELRAELDLNGAGRAALDAHLRTAAGAIRACAARQAVAAGPVTLRCRLRSAIQKRRKARWLRLDVVVSVRSHGGAHESIGRRVHVRRLNEG